ncbi:MAG: TetR/AcrR family transcriptional regulator [Acidobacteriota bacterium]
MNSLDLRKKRELKRRQENKRFILEVAERLFVKNGYRKTAMDDIADEAQFSKATVYRYFDSKLDIFTQIVLNSIEGYQKELTKITEEKTSAETRIKKVICSILLYFQKKKNLARLLFIERDLLKKFVEVEKESHFFRPFKKKKIPENLEVVFQDIFNQISGVFKEGISSGEFRKMDPREACLVLGSFVRGFHFSGFEKIKEYSLKESTELISDIFLNGIKKP